MTILSCAEEVDVVLRLGTPGNQLALSADCPDGGVGIWWNELSLPQFALRYQWAPSSMVVPGQVLLSATMDRSSIAARVVAIGTTAAELEAQKAILAASVGRFRYNVSIVHGAQSLGSWVAGPTTPIWDDALSPHRSATYTAGASLLIPVQPTGAP